MRTTIRNYLRLCAVMGLAFTGWLAQADPPDTDPEAAHLRHIKQLTFDGARSGEGYFSRDV